VELTKLIASLDKFLSRIALSVLTPCHLQVMGQLSMSLSTRFWGTFSMSLHNLRPFSRIVPLPTIPFFVTTKTLSLGNSGYIFHGKGYFQVLQLHQEQ